MASYAVVETGGKQYLVAKGDTLLVDRLSEAKEGDKVEAKVIGHERGPKLRIFKYRPKKGYRRRAGHRSELTRLEVTELKLLQRKPAGSGTKSATKKSSPKKKPAAKKEKKDGS